MYPSNSRRSKRGSDEEPQRKLKVIKGNIVERKKPLLMRIFGENTKSVGNYILWDVLIPAGKNTITEMISNGIEMLLYGEPRSNVRRDRGRSYVSYNSYYKDRDREPDSRRLEIGKNRHRFEDVVLESRSDAEEVLSNLVDLVEDYGVATVADFYDLVGLSGEWADNKYGWDNLSRSSVKRVRDGYILEMPKPLVIE